MNTLEQRLNVLETLMDSMPLGQWVNINDVSRDPKSFIDAIKYLIDFEKKPYEFNNSTYTKVRRFDNEQY